MKFGKELATAAAVAGAQWKDKFISYKRLKRIIKKIETESIQSASVTKSTNNDDVSETTHLIPPAPEVYVPSPSYSTSNQ